MAKAIGHVVYLGGIINNPESESVPLYSLPNIEYATRNFQNSRTFNVNGRVFRNIPICGTSIRNYYDHEGEMDDTRPPTLKNVAYSHN